MTRDELIEAGSQELKFKKGVVRVQPAILEALLDRWEPLIRADERAKNSPVYGTPLCTLRVPTPMRRPSTSCAYSLALDNGIDMGVWKGHENRPVAVGIYMDRLVPYLIEGGGE